MHLGAWSGPLPALTSGREFLFLMRTFDYSDAPTCVALVWMGHVAEVVVRAATAGGDEVFPSVGSLRGHFPPPSALATFETDGIPLATCHLRNT